MLFRRSLARAVLLALACSAFRLFAADAPWTEFKTDHFILDTDAPENANLMMASLEKARATDIAVLVGGDVDLPGHIRVIAPASQGMFLEMAGDWVGAFYDHGPYSEPVVLAPTKAFFTEPETIAHELAHAVSFYLFPEQPHWYAEGLAAFVETVAALPAVNASNLGSHIVHAGTSGNGVGGIPRGYGGAILEGSFAVPSAQLLVWKGTEDPAVPGRYHFASWMLYHYLWNQRGKELAAFQKRLLDGEGFKSAWLASFANLDPGNAAQMKALDDAIFEYGKSGRFVMAKVQTNPEFKLVQQPVSQADMKLWLIFLRQVWPQKKEEKALLARAQLEKVRLLAPKNPAMLMGLAALDGKITPEQARAAANGAPDDYRGWYWLGNAATDPKEKEMAFRKAVALGTECPGCNNNLAWLLVTSGRAKEALPFANRSLDLAPWDSAAVDTLAAIALELGQCPQALQLQARAASMDLLQGDKPDKTEARLKSIQQRCSAK
jgi:tetratricopeptide (TPR) repeat protein